MNITALVAASRSSRVSNALVHSRSHTVLDHTIRTTIRSAQTRRILPICRTISQQTRPRIRPIPVLWRPPLRREYAQQKFVSSWQAFREAVREGNREHPVLGPLIIFMIPVCFLSVCWVILLYWVYYKPIDEKYPPEVAVKLKRAFHNMYKINPPDYQKAHDYYHEAIKLALGSHGMHAFSEEVIGIKIKLGELYERIHMFQEAIHTYDRIGAECEKFLAGGYLGSPEALNVPPAHRSRLLGIIAQCHLKVGEIYSNDAIQDSAAAEKAISQGVEVIVNEERRRQDPEFVKDPADAWLDGQQIGAAFEAMADTYEKKNAHQLAGALYLQALTYSEKNCHAVVLMNNLAQSLAQTLPDMGMDMAATRETFIENARSWAKKALDTAAEIKPPERNEECDLSCAVATHNLGEFAEMQQRYDEATKLYHEARSLAQALKFKEGIKNANKGLERVEKLKTG